MRGSTVAILHVASGELTFSIMAGWKFLLAELHPVHNLEFFRV